LFECVVAIVLLARFASLPEAHVVKSVLEAEGIDVLMPEQGLVAGELDMGVMGGWRLMVCEDDIEPARRILEAARDERASHADRLRCYAPGGGTGCAG
jgi:hypothetical protein